MRLRQTGALPYFRILPARPPVFPEQQAATRFQGVFQQNIRRTQMDTLRLWLVVGFFAGTMIYTVLVMIFQPV